MLLKSLANPITMVRLGEWDVSGADCAGSVCLPAVQDFQVSLKDFTIHEDFNYDNVAKIVINDIGIDEDKQIQSRNVLKSRKICFTRFQCLFNENF